jgi:hypothetical protein
VFVCLLGISFTGSECINLLPIAQLAGTK